MQVSEISFGCWTMGGLNWVNGVPNGWADPDETEIAEGIKVGLDAGVNYFDNADVYGNGRAEQMLARVLKRLGVKNTDVIIATKVGHFPGTAAHAYEPAHIRHQCEQSLLNLERDYLDLYYFHHGDFGENDRYLAGAVEMMNRLVKEGKVRYVGLSAYSPDDFARLVPVIQPHVLQGAANALSDRFLRAGSPVQNLMEQRDLALVAFSPLGRGRLLNKYDPKKPPEFEFGDNRRGKPEYSAEALAALKPKLDKLAARFGSSVGALAAMALQYVLAHPRVACVIPGFRNARQAASNVAAEGKALTAEELAFIRETLG
jgi:aryl-alcohol dehydrogenase-like predicted oxidoreductase